MDEVGERYEELGGLPSESDRERGRRRVQQLRDVLDAAVCADCRHLMSEHHGPVCAHEDCGPCGPNESDAA